MRSESSLNSVISGIEAATTPLWHYLPMRLYSNLGAVSEHFVSGWISAFDGYLP